MNAYSWRIPWRAALVAAAIGACTAIATKSDAACYCVCLNGYVQNVCDNDYDLPQVCAPRVCPVPPSPLQPVAPPVVPAPGGGRDCQYEYVLDEETMMYEWVLLCR